MTGATRAEIAAVACSDLFRGDRRILASTTGTVATIGARLAALTHAPDLMLTDAESSILGEFSAIDAPSEAIAGSLTYRQLFELISTGKRHCIMGAAQLDRRGNQNLSAIGDHERPTRQLLGTRAAATNTTNHPVSYFIPRHTRRVFVDRVDFVTGVGPSRALEYSMAYNEIRGVVTNLGVFDFSGPGKTMSIVSLHPGVELAELQASTGFEMHRSGKVTPTRSPEQHELQLIREVLDPRARRDEEIPPA